MPMTDTHISNQNNIILQLHDNIHNIHDFLRIFITYIYNYLQKSFFSHSIGFTRSFQELGTILLF